MKHTLLSFFFSCIIFPIAVWAQKEQVLVYGEAFARSQSLKKSLRKHGLKVQELQALDLLGLQPEKGRLLVLSERVPPGTRGSISRYLQSGGNLLLIGSQVFDYRPRPVHSVPLADFSDPGAYKIFTPEGTPRVASMDKPMIRTVDVPGTGSKGLTFTTEKRGMADVYVRVSLRQAASPERSVLSFHARGNAFMDLLALRIKDLHGQVWLSFVPITPEWKNYSISLADFIPEGWSNQSNYPLLNPGEVDSLALGVNLRTVWKEKAMSFALGGLALGEDESGVYAPTSSLRPLRLPFFENQTRIPDWLADPFIGSRTIQQSLTLISPEPALFGEVSQSVGNVRALAPALVEFPGSKMGTDTKKAYNFRESRKRRSVSILETSQGASVARLDIHADGPYSGAAVGAFGLPAEVITENEVLLNVMAKTADYILHSPRILNIDVNTTRKKPGKPVTPKFKVSLQNPNSNKAEGNLTLRIAGYPIKRVSVEIPASGRTDRILQLNSVPEDFKLADFEWTLKLETKSGKDSLHEHVNVERAMIHAFILLTQAQKRYPDGRISNHYFGDAYGVRAMFAYLDYLERHPGRLNYNKDLWAQISPEEIRACALRFCDMLVERQLPNGALPMGYSEHAGGYNVADAGQMAIALSQLSRYVKDPVKKQAYMNVVYRFFDWAESFYIDQDKSDSLRVSEPEAFKKGDARAGFYGLGQSGRSRRETGPSWVLSDILAAQLYLGYVDHSARKPYYRKIAERNAEFYVAGKFSAAGYYQAEALFWAWLTSSDQALRTEIEATLNETFLPPLYQGKWGDMYDLGGRATLKALPLLYYQELIGNTAANRAVLLKYIWSFASEDAMSSMAGLSSLFPKPVHGESLAAAKFAALSALWGMELLEPGSTLYKTASSRINQPE